MKKLLATSALLCLNFFPAMGDDLLQYRLFAEPAKRYIIAAQGKDIELARVSQQYLNGDGVPQDYREFASRISAAADQKDQWAQLMLGLAYFSGRGVPHDVVRSHMWSNLAGAGGDENLALVAKKQRDTISVTMSERQIAQAKDLARNWNSPQEAEKNPRAEKHPRWAFWRR